MLKGPSHAVHSSGLPTQARISARPSHVSADSESSASTQTATKTSVRNRRTRSAGEAISDTSRGFLRHGDDAVAVTSNPVLIWLFLNTAQPPNIFGKPGSSSQHPITVILVKFYHQLATMYLGQVNFQFQPAQSLLSTTCLSLGQVAVSSIQIPPSSGRTPGSTGNILSSATQVNSCDSSQVPRSTSSLFSLSNVNTMPSQTNTSSSSTSAFVSNHPVYKSSGIASAIDGARGCSHFVTFQEALLHVHGLQLLASRHVDHAGSHQRPIQLRLAKQ